MNHLKLLILIALMLVDGIFSKKELNDKVNSEIFKYRSSFNQFCTGKYRDYCTNDFFLFSEQFIKQMRKEIKNVIEEKKEILKKAFLVRKQKIKEQNQWIQNLRKHFLDRHF